LDAKRSLVDPTGTLVFPDNVETEALLTFSSDAPGDEVVSTTPVPNAMTLRVHHSFVRLPDSQYQARLADPRISSVPYPIRDYAAGLDEPIEKRLVVRHRLELSADGSVKKPIVFYVDRGAPEPVRSALVEGARWWTEAFEAAGFPGGYKVEILPEGAHPLDARYNVIQWAHRETRGWSYGNPIIDPRTGEIIKGIVTLGSLRLRQDRMIFEGLLGAQNTGSGRPDDPVQLALARVRQLSAHEVGHCLGFLHNMAASSNDRASVMDYPAPWIRPRTDGTLDVTKAYSVGIGAWDKLAVKYSYAPTPPGQEEARFLDSIAAQGKALGLNYVVDPHARGLGAAHPQGSLWDNGNDPITMLDETMEVRRIALSSFGPRNIREGQSLSDLYDVLVPVYLYHRYQLRAAAKLIGGAQWRYGKTGANEEVKSISGTQQRQALAAILRTLDPAALELPDSVLDTLIPEPVGWWEGSRGERFSEPTTPLFDPIQATRTAADLTFAVLLHPSRLARVEEQHRRDPAQLGLPELLEQTRSALAGSDRRSLRAALLGRYVAKVVEVGATAPAPISDHLRSHLGNLKRDALRANLPEIAARIGRFEARSGPSAPSSPKSEKIPPGSPIGAGDIETQWHPAYRP
ncbi:MAG: zinc-dependent metalloprotease, partial [Myxococcota bacterium]